MPMFSDFLLCLETGIDGTNYNICGTHRLCVETGIEDGTNCGCGVFVMLFVTQVVVEQ